MDTVPAEDPLFVTFHSTTSALQLAAETVRIAVTLSELKVFVEKK